MLNVISRSIMQIPHRTSSGMPVGKWTPSSCSFASIGLFRDIIPKVISAGTHPSHVGLRHDHFRAICCSAEWEEERLLRAQSEVKALEPRAHTALCFSFR